MVFVMIEEVCNDLTDFAVDISIMFDHVRGIPDWAWYHASDLHGTAKDSIASD